jgi:N-methylhydantoinase A
LLGYLKPEHAIGRERGVLMDPDLSARAIEAGIAKRLELSTEAAAEAILTVAGAKMGGHIRRKLLEKGLDPREFSIVAFGGAGPLHANRLLREVGLRNAIVPYLPGITSAMGCIFGDLRHDFLKTVNRRLSTLADLSVVGICAEFADEGRKLLEMEGATQNSIAVSYGGDMCYRGQSNVIPVVFPPNDLSWSGVRLAFEGAYRERYGRLLERAEIMFVNARVTVSSSGRSTKSLAPFVRLARAPMPGPEKTRVFFGGRWLEAKLYDRHALPMHATVEGPAVLLQPDTTTFVEPGFVGTVHPSGNLLISAVQ